MTQVYQCQVCCEVTENGECKCVRVSNLGFSHDALIIEVASLKAENESLRKVLNSARDTIIFFDNECDVLKEIESELKGKKDE